MVLAAMENNFHSLGISSHGPVDVETDWNIKRNRIEEYIEAVTVLKNKYKDKIDIFLGMELDFIPGTGFSETSMSLINRLDYFIGSVHYLGKLNNGLMWTVDYTMEELIRGIEESFHGSVRKAVEKYYETISEMTVKYQPPVIGHLDLIKKHNKNDFLFREDESWYVKSVKNCLDIIKSISSAVEVNTGGMARGFTKEQYPSTFILKMIKERDIPVIVSTDAHTAEAVGYKLKEMYKLLKELGFEKTVYLTRDGWKKQILM